MAEPFKTLLDARGVRDIAQHLQRAWPRFDAAAFEAAALHGLDALEFDAVPTEGSDNVMTSGAIYTALQGVDAAIADAKGVQMAEVKALLAQILGSLSSTVPKTFDEQHATLQALVTALKGDA